MFHEENTLAELLRGLLLGDSVLFIVPCFTVCVGVWMRIMLYSEVITGW